MPKKKRKLRNSAAQRGGGARANNKAVTGWRDWFAPPELHAVARRDWLALALLALAAFALYAASAPHTVQLEDDGLFITAAKYAGVVHPPGYPLFVGLSWLAGLIPVGGIAWRVHCLSGLMGALTCAAISWIVLRRTGNRPAAYLAGAALAVSEHFWSQAIIADVYTLNTALLFGTWALIQEAAAANSAKRATGLWVAAALLIGAGLANHLPLLVLGSPLLLAPVLVAGRDFWRRVPYLLPLALAVAGLLYGWLLWRSHVATPVNFLGVIDNWDTFWGYIARKLYVGTDNSVNSGMADKLGYARYFVTQLFTQFSPLGFGLALWGLLAAWRAGLRAHIGLLCELAAFFCSSFLLIWLLGFDYEYLTTAVFRPYMLIAYCILALWFGFGLHACLKALRARGAWFAPAFAALCLCLFAGTGVWNGIKNENYQPHSSFAAEQARTILNMLEPNSVLIAYGDMYIFPLAYMQMVEGMRPDVRLLNYSGQMLEDREVEPLDWKWNNDQVSARWKEFIRANRRPLYTTTSGPTLSNYGKRHLAFLRETELHAPAGQISIQPNPGLKRRFRELLAEPPRKNRWNNAFINECLELYGRYLGYVQVSDNADMYRHVQDVLPAAQNNYWSLLGMIRAMLRHGDKSDLAWHYLQRAKELAGEDRNKSQVAELIYMEGVIENNRGNSRRAHALLRQSIEINRSRMNPSHWALQQMQAGAR